MKKQKQTILILMLVIGLVALLIAACGGTKETTTTAPAQTTTTGPAATETTGPAATETTAPGGTETTVAWGDDVVIGVINSMTGSNTLTGEEQLWAQKKAVDDLNAAGGLLLNDGKHHKVVLKVADDKSVPAEGAAAMEKLIKVEGLKIILGSNITPVNQAAALVAEKYGAYFHINTSWIDDADPATGFPGFIGGMNLKWTTDMFEKALSAGDAPVGAAQNLPEADQPQNWAIMVENTPDGAGIGAGVEGAAKAAGYNVVMTETFTEGNKDFSPIILKFKKANIDAMVTLIAPTDGITFVKQAKENNWAPKFMFGYKGFWPVNFMKALGPDSDYICNDGFWWEGLPYPGAKELGEAFVASHNGNDSVSIGNPYAAFQVLAEAINDVGSVDDPKAIRDRVAGHTFKDTVMGDVTYNDRGLCHIRMLGLQWKNGERTLVHPKALAEGPTQVFVPWDKR